MESGNERRYDNDSEYDGNDGQSEESEESDEENELSQPGGDTDRQWAWGMSRPILRVFLTSQRSILKITAGNPQSSTMRISYPKLRTLAPVRFRQTRYTFAIPSHSPTVLNPLATPAITSSYPDPTMPVLDSRGGHEASSRQNMASGLEHSILATAYNLM